MRGRAPAVTVFAHSSDLESLRSFFEELARERHVVVPAFGTAVARDAVNLDGLGSHDLIATSGLSGIATLHAAASPRSIRRLALLSPDEIVHEQAVAGALAQVTAPTLLVYGARHWTLTAAGTSAFAARLRTGREIRLISGAGARPAQERPRESAWAVLDWLRPTG